MNCYGLPSSFFVDEAIAIGISFGFFRDLSASKEYEQVVVFPNCGSEFLTITVIRFTNGRMEMVYSVSKDNVGGRYYTKAMMNVLLKDIDEQKRQEVLSNSSLRMRFFDAAEKPKATLGSLDVEQTDVQVINPFDYEDEEDFEKEVNRSEFEQECQNMNLDSKIREALTETVQVYFNESFDL